MGICENFEIAIEERRLGALGAEAAAQLEEHLASCASCQNFADFVRDSEKSMQANDATMKEADWAAIKKTLRRAPELMRNQRLISVILVLTATPLIGMSFMGSQLGIFIPIFITMFFVFSTLRYFFFDRRLTRDMQQTGARDAEFFLHYRKVLRRQRAWIWIAMIVAPLYAIQMAGLGWLLGGRGDEVTMMCRALLVVVGFLLSFWIYRARLSPLNQVLAQLP